VTSDGVVTTIGGMAGMTGSEPGAGPTAQFFAPEGITVDASGNLYVADAGNNRICKGTPLENPAITTERVSDISFYQQPLSTIEQIPGVSQGKPYSRTLHAAGGTLPYSWAISAGALPAGMTLSSAGVLSGTPTTLGTSTFSIAVTDASGKSDSRAYRLAVEGPPSAPQPQINAPPDGRTGITYSQPLSASGGESPYLWKVVAGALPPGLNLSDRGLVSGTPTAAGTFNFTVKITGNNGLAATRSYSLVSVARPQPAKADWYAITPVVLPASATLSEVVAVNASGQVFGSYYTGDGESRAFVWKAGKTTTLLPPGAVDSMVADANASGQVVGTFTNADDETRGFLWKNAAYTILLPSGAASSNALAINAGGLVVGGGTNENYVETAYQWKAGSFASLNPAGAEQSEATGIGPDGQVVGTYSDGAEQWKAFVWSDGTFADIAIPGATFIYPYAVNSYGEVAGFYTDASDGDWGFVWKGGQVTTLKPPGAVGSGAYSINAAGQVVGEYVDAKDNFHAFVWMAGKFILLDDKIIAKSGWVLEQALKITDSGLIVGMGTKNGESQAFFLTPKSGTKPPATKPPTLSVSTKVKATTKTKKLTVKGKAKGEVTAVYYKAGGSYKLADGLADWTFAVTLKKGRNVLSIYAEGPGGKSAIKQIKTTLE